jgi:hypothetical protein
VPVERDLAGAQPDHAGRGDVEGEGRPRDDDLTRTVQDLHQVHQHLAGAVADHYVLGGHAGVGVGYRLAQGIGVAVGVAPGPGEGLDQGFSRLGERAEGELVHRQLDEPRRAAIYRDLLPHPGRVVGMQLVQHGSEPQVLISHLVVGSFTAEDRAPMRRTQHRLFPDHESTSSPTMPGARAVRAPEPAVRG